MFLSTKELAKLWNVDQSRILKLARDGRIDGAVLFGKNWMFPRDTKKPEDARKSSSKIQEKKEPYYRFPLYVNFSPENFTPALSEEEEKLREAQLAFYECDFKEAEELLLDIKNRTDNIYIKVPALSYLCTISMYQNYTAFNTYTKEFNALLENDFPYKEEMLLFRYWFNADIGFYKSILEDFSIDPTYSYHPSAYYTFALISIYPLENGDLTVLSKLRYDTYELLCKQMERDGYVSEAQRLHGALLTVYHLKEDEGKSLYHIRKMLEIAYERHFYYEVASYMRYYTKQFSKVLSEFPNEFETTIIALSRKLQKSIQEFTKMCQCQTFLGILSEREFEYAFLATQGYSNRDIAKTSNISEKLVSKIYNEIYDKLGVKNKHELIETINKTHFSYELK